MIWIDYAWIIFGTAIIAGFWILELTALHLQRKGHTCSADARRWLHTDTKRGRTVWIIISGLGAMFLIWFTAHILGPSLAWWP